MNNPDSAIKEIVRKIREAGGDVEHPDLSSHYIAYLASLLKANSLLDDRIQHLLQLHDQLHSGEYLNKGRTSTSPLLITGLQRLVKSREKDSLPTLVGKTFICHQILEEMFFRLVKASHFLIDLRLGTYRIQHPEIDNGIWGRILYCASRGWIDSRFEKCVRTHPLAILHPPHIVFSRHCPLG
jgi:hypothetical protein